MLVATSDLMTFVGTVLGRPGASWGAWFLVSRLRSAPFLRVISGDKPRLLVTALNSAPVIFYPTDTFAELEPRCFSSEIRSPLVIA